jgi:hypothetical protein
MLIVPLICVMLASVLAACGAQPSTTPAAEASST